MHKRSLTFLSGLTNVVLTVAGSHSGRVDYLALSSARFARQFPRWRRERIDTVNDFGRKNDLDRADFPRKALGGNSLPRNGCVPEVT